MAGKNDTAALLGALVITLGVLGAGGWWFLNQNQSLRLPTSLGDVLNQGDATARLSRGERLLLQGDRQPDKEQGVVAYGAGDFTEAIRLFQASLQATPNDPETLIYLNNAKIRQQTPNAQAIAVVVSLPVDTNTSGAKEILRGVAQAQKEALDRGNGFVVVLADDDGDPAIAAEVAQALANQADILGVVGHFGSDTSLAAAQIYEAEGLVMISPTSTTVSLATAGNYIFRTVPSDRFTGTALANYLLDRLNQQQVVVFYNSASNYSNSLKDSLTTELFTQGGTVVAEVDVSQGGFNSAQALTEAKSKGATAIALVTDTPTLNQALQVIQVNENELAIVAGDSLYKPEILQIGGRDAVDMVIAIPWHILRHSDTAFAQVSRALWGGDVNWRTALSYDAAIALMTGIQQSSTPDRQNLQQTLASPNFSALGAAQTIQFLPSGDRNQALEMVTVQPGERSGFGYDFVPVP
ncbi:ABC transporter substrate-binding protein [Synechococcus moorigangaii CMS01]|nr:ABC transporter substrate-binding protein [Synechococcus moorigangaii CMS01]